VGGVRRLACCLALAAALSGCNSGEAHERTFAETEGLYINVGALTYQIQLSRQLNPSDVEDRDYLSGLPEGTEEPSGDEAWFGIFLRVQNQTDKSLSTARRFEITASDESSYSPVAVDAERNVFAYKPVTREPEGILPERDSAAENNNPIRGEMLLFKIPYDTFYNRPLEFHIKPTLGQEGVIDIDV